MSWIRKYQKGMLVVFGVALMVVFLVPQLADFGGGRVAVENPVVVTWNGGSLKRLDLDRLRTRHFQTVRFLNVLLDFARQKSGPDAVVNPLIEQITPILGQGENDQEAADNRIFDRYLLAQEAEKMGVNVGEGMIDEYIAYSAGDVNVTPSELQHICRLATDGQASLGQIREQLRLELAYRQMQIMTQAGYQLIPNPSNAAQLFARSSEEIECTVLPVVVTDYLDKVTTEATEKELRDIFHEGQYRLPGGDPEVPAFKTPKRINLQYVYAEFETALQNEINKLTDEEVQKEYDRLVAAEDFSVMELIDETETTPETNPDGTPKAADPTATGGGDPATAEDPAKKDAAADGEKTPEAKTGDAEKTGAAGDGKSDTVDPAKKADGTAGQGDAGKTNSGSGGDGLTRLNQNWSDPGETGTEVFVSTGNSGSTQDPPVQDPPPVTTPPVQDPPKTDPPATDPPAKQEGNPALDQSGVAPPTGGETGSGVVEPAKVQEPLRRARPLKDVADQIKRRMKIEAASDAIRDKLVTVETAVRQYQSDFMIWQATPEGEREAEPAKVDLKKLADEHGLKFGETGIVTFEELMKTKVGELPVSTISLERSIPVSIYVFSRFNQLQLFDPDTQMDLGNGDTWLYWPSEKEEVKVGEFEEVRAKVLEFRKMKEARIIARAQAENYVAEINGGGVRLAQRFGEKAVSTGLFSWFTNSFSGFGFGQPLGVDGPGDEFMKTAFGLEMDRAGFAPNEAGDKYYVIQKTGNDRRSDEEVTGNFINQVAMFQRVPVTVYNAGETLLQKVQFDFGQQLQKKLNIEWKDR